MSIDADLRSPLGQANVRLDEPMARHTAAEGRWPGRVVGRAVERTRSRETSAVLPCARDSGHTRWAWDKSSGA